MVQLLWVKQIWMNMEWGNIRLILNAFRSLGMYGYNDKKIVKNPID